jgi:adenine-specific DNA-methyltransferase
VANDLHAYAEVVAKSLLTAPTNHPTSLNAVEDLTEAYQRNSRSLTKVLRTRLDQEAEALGRADDVGGWRVLKAFSDAELQSGAPRPIRGLGPLSAYREKTKRTPYSLFSRYFASAYIGVGQAIEVDSLRYAIEHAPVEHRNCYLAALIHALSHCAATPGHFAQFLVPRDRKNTIYIARIRRRSVLERFHDALDTVVRPRCHDRAANEVFRSEAIAFLEARAGVFDDGSLVIYADPPYSRAQYSRYYHVLETLVRYDYPDCTGKGRYRSDRIQTAFSQKARVVTAMDRFVRAAAQSGAPLYLSYPQNGLLQQAGGNLKTLLRSHYPHVELATRAPLDHSTLGGAPGTASVEVVEDVYYAGWK